MTKDHFTKNQDKRRAFSTKVTFLLAFLQGWPLLPTKKGQTNEWHWNSTESTESSLSPPQGFCRITANDQHGYEGSVAVHFKVQKEAPDNRKTTLRLPIVESPSKKCKWKMEITSSLRSLCCVCLHSTGKWTKRLVKLYTLLVIAMKNWRYCRLFIVILVKTNNFEKYHSGEIFFTKFNSEGIKVSFSIFYDLFHFLLSNTSLESYFGVWNVHLLYWTTLASHKDYITWKYNSD